MSIRHPSVIKVKITLSILVLLLISLLLMPGIFYLNNRLDALSSLSTNIKPESFSVTEYKEYFYLDTASKFLITFGPIHTIQEAENAAFDVHLYNFRVDKYSLPKDSYTFHVEFDSEYRIWHVTFESDYQLRWVYHMLISADEGRILLAWLC